MKSHNGYVKEKRRTTSQGSSGPGEGDKKHLKLRTFLAAQGRRKKNHVNLRTVLADQGGENKKKPRQTSQGSGGPGEKGEKKEITSNFARFWRLKGTNEN